MTELLAPAGDIASAYAALRAGADAVYLGLTRFSAREGAENFSVSDLRALARDAHLLGAKVYVALNTLVKDDELEAFFESARTAWESGADAILLQDIFLGRELKRAYPQMTLHLSTQAGCCNADGARVARDFGFARVVLARETPLKDIASISAVIETEAFVQGALCSCFSGQCYFSSFAGNNSGNRGRCKQPCRKLYSLDCKGFERPAYALSLSDLSVGPDVHRYLEAGVSSLKIEGRMRSPAYAAAATAYYRALLDGSPSDEAFSRMRRAFNRGGYTRGLAFGQDATLLSRDVQGHIGERVGVVSRRGGKYYCESAFRPVQGDAFKILRGGKEAGGAIFSAQDAHGFYLVSQARLADGDEVRVTTDTAANARSLAYRRLRPVDVHVVIRQGEPARAVCGDYVCTGAIAQPAKNAPLSAERIRSCFVRTDAYPFAPAVTVETDGAFLPVSSLNALRRAFYEGLAAHLAPPRAPLPDMPLPPHVSETAAMSASSDMPCPAVIVSDGADIAGAGTVVYKPKSYARLAPPCPSERAYLYLPAFFTADDEALIAPYIAEYAGIYCEGTYGIALAERYATALFAGTGWNITNRIAAAGAAQCARHAALSKELTVREQDALARFRVCALTGGDLKLMDLCYCPFGRTCASCDRRAEYMLSDEAGRKFPLRRFEAAGGCRFEVYNYAPLAAGGGACAPLVDCTRADMRVVACAREPEKALPGATHGHARRSLL